MINIKGLFTKGTSIGRWELIKISILPVFFIFPLAFWLITIPPERIIQVGICLSILAMLCVFYIFFNLVAEYRRFANIFENEKIVKSIFIIYLLFSILACVDGLPNWILIPIVCINWILLAVLLLVPGKKQSFEVISNKFIVCLTISFILLYIVLFFIVRGTGIMRYIVSDSMTDTLIKNDRIFINVFDKNYNRGNIIVYQPNWENNKSMVFVKRIIGVPGDKIEIKVDKDNNGFVYVNDKLLEEPYLKPSQKYSQCSEEMVCKISLISENMYFVMGDNRSNSRDSRYDGLLPADKIRGKVSHIYFPIERRKGF